MMIIISHGATRSAKRARPLKIERCLIQLQDLFMIDKDKMVPIETRRMIGPLIRMPAAVPAQNNRGAPINFCLILSFARQIKNRPDCAMAVAASKRASVLAILDSIETIKIEAMMRPE